MGVGSRVWGLGFRVSVLRIGFRIRLSREFRAFVLGHRDSLLVFW